MFVGYVIKHEGACYEMLDSKHSILYESQDVIWLYQMYYKKINQDNDKLQPWPEAWDPDKDQRNIQVKEDDKKEQQTNDDEELVAASEGEIEKIDEA
eukprot:1406663-Ditylum_brightwellii.AAC.1